MLHALLLVTVAAQPVKLASVGFQQLNLSESTAAFFADHFAQKLAEQPGLRVVTQRDIANALGLERQRQLLGCADTSSSCMAELAGALGVDGLVTGQLAKIGNAYQLNVKVLATDATRPLFLFSTKVLTEEAVLEALNVAARQAARELPQTLEGLDPASLQVVAASETASQPLRWKPILTMAGGGALALGGVPFLADAITRWRQLDYAGVNQGYSKDGKLITPLEARELRDIGARNQAIGWVMVGLGVAVAAGGFVWWMRDAPDESPTVWLAPNGTGVTVGGTLP